MGSRRASRRGSKRTSRRAPEGAQMGVQLEGPDWGVHVLYRPTNQFLWAECNLVKLRVPGTLRDWKLSPRRVKI